MNETIKVLDHGYVKLCQAMGTDETVIEAARMSTGKGFIGWDWYEECSVCGEIKSADTDQTCRVMAGVRSHGQILDVMAYEPHQWKKKRDADLLDFMYRNRHLSPFETCELHIEVQAPIMVFREWHRHRTMAYNEFSARYSVMPNLHYVPEIERFMPKTSANKQESSAKLVAMADELSFDPMTDTMDVREEQNEIYRNYEEMLDRGVPKEVARINTPVSRYSKMRAKTDLRNWLGFLNLRMRPNAQLEIRLYANAVAEIIKNIWPRTYALFEEYDLYGAHLSRSELSLLRGITGIPLAEQGPRSELSASQRKEFDKKIRSGGIEIL